MSTSAPDPGRQQVPAGEYARRRKPFVQQSFADMLRSMVLVVLGIALLYGCGQLLETDSAPPVRTVDYASDLAAARDIADYDVLAPTQLPAGWRATSVDVDRSGDGVAWHLGFLTPDDRYVGLEQTDGELPAHITEAIEGLDPVRTVRIDGGAWAVFAAAEEETVLVQEQPDVTTVVNGTAPVADLSRFAAALR